MYPLVYHLGVDDYFPDEEFEPHLFRHVAAARRADRQPSLTRRLGSALLRTVGVGRGTPDATRSPQPSSRVTEPAIRWS